MDDVASGAFKFLIAQPSVIGMLGVFPPDDPVNAGQPFLFQRNVYQRMEGMGIVQQSQAVAMIVSQAGSWQSPIDRSSARFTRLQLAVWVDPLRDVLGNITNPAEAENRGMNAWAVADALLHRIGSPEVQVWGDLVTTGSTRLTEPVWLPLPDGDGLLAATVFYGVQAYGNLNPPSYAVTSSDTGGGIDH